MFIFDNLDSMILYHLILVLFGNIFFTVVGLLSQSRYAIIATARSEEHTSNSSHTVISYAVFCLKKKKNNTKKKKNKQKYN